MALRYSRFILAVAAILCGVLCVAVSGRAAESAALQNRETLVTLGYEPALVQLWLRNRPELVAMINAASERDHPRLQQLLDEVFPIADRTDSDKKWLKELRLDASPITVYRGLTGHPQKYDSKNSVFSMVDSPNEMYVSPDFTYAMRYATKFAVSAEPVTLIVDRLVADWLSSEGSEGIKWEAPHAVRPFQCETLFSN